MRARQRIERLRGRHALVDGIPFVLPVDSSDTPALMAAFPISAARAAELIPGEEVHPFRLGGDVGLLLITVVDYRTTDIGSYVEFSIAIACTHGLSPAPPVLPALLGGRYGTGQFVVDLPVSTEVSVKGGKGIWGMPKHQANLDFVIREDKVWSQYDLDGRLCCRIEVDTPRWAGLPVSMAAVNYCAFRGMLNKSSIHFRGRAGLHLPFSRTARLTLGDHPRVAPLKRLKVRERPLFAGYLPSTRGILDDHMESWFLTFTDPPETAPEGLESVAGLGLGREWLAPPNDPGGPDAGARTLMADVTELERRALTGVGALTALTGALQAATPSLTLGVLDADQSATSRHFFGTVGMFMVCTGSMLVARPRDRAVVLVTAAQKVGAAAAVTLGVRRGLLSPLALLVAGFDALSGLLALHYRSRLR